MSGEASRSPLFPDGERVARPCARGGVPGAATADPRGSGPSLRAGRRPVALRPLSPAPRSVPVRAEVSPRSPDTFHQQHAVHDRTRRRASGVRLRLWQEPRLVRGATHAATQRGKGRVPAGGEASSRRKRAGNSTVARPCGRGGVPCQAHRAGRSRRHVPAGGEASTSGVNSASAVGVRLCGRGGFFARRVDSHVKQRSAYSLVSSWAKTSNILEE